MRLLEILMTASLLFYGGTATYTICQAYRAERLIPTEISLKSCVQVAKAYSRRSCEKKPKISKQDHGKIATDSLTTIISWKASEVVTHKDCAAISRMPRQHLLAYFWWQGTLCEF